MSAPVTTLTEKERALVRETEPKRMAGLDEDELVDLHRRIRRARNKFVGQYRREASAKVAQKGGRGVARPKNRRNAAKAEVFEDALARVSRRLAVAARASAAELKAERLAGARADAEAARAAEAAGRAGARAGGGSGASKQRSGPATASTKVGRGQGSVTKNAASAAKGAKRQAGRDSR